MKIKTTNKAIRESSYRITALSYCEAPNLLRCMEPVCYTCGIYGWNADVYRINGQTIVTGYRPIGTRKPYAITEVYEQRASAIWNDPRSYNEYTHDQRKEDGYCILWEWMNVN